MSDKCIYPNGPCKDNPDCIGCEYDHKGQAHKPEPNGSVSSSRTTGCRDAAGVDCETTQFNSPIAVPRHARNRDSGGVCTICKKSTHISHRILNI